MVRFFSIFATRDEVNSTTYKTPEKTRRTILVML